MNENSSTDRENRRLRARVEDLQEQLANLATDNRDLHLQMAAVIDHLSTSGPPGNISGTSQLKLPPPAPAEPLIRRGIRKALRTVAGAVRTIRRATDPGADMVRVLSPVADPSPPGDLPKLGGDILLDLSGDVDPALVGAVDLPWLFALEDIDAAWIRPPGGDTEVLAARRDLFDSLRERGKPGLAQAATDLGRPVIAKQLPDPSPLDDKEWILHPVLFDDGSTVWRNSAYLVGLPPGVRRAELRVKTTAAPRIIEDPIDLFILISEPPVEGLEQRLAFGIEAVGDLRRTLVSLAPWTESGQRRLRALSSTGMPVHDFGSFLHRTTWGTAVQALLKSSAPKTLWAIGDSNDLGPFLDQAREIAPALRVVGEAVDSDSVPTPADTTIVRTKAQRARLEGIPGVGSLHIAQTPLGIRAPKGKPETRRILGVPADATLVVVSGDLTPSGRAEDAAAVARHLAGREDIWFRVVGRGPLAPAIGDLGRLFGLQRFAVIEPDNSLDDIVAAADIVCCPGRSDVLPPSAAMAVASGVPVVAPSTGEAAEMAESGISGIHLGGAAGDTEKLADAVVEAVEAGPSSSGLPEEEVTNRAKNAGRIYREALTGQKT